MIISRSRYEQDLKEAYEKGRYEAEERCYRDRALERVWEELGRIQEKLRMQERKNKPESAEPVPEGCPFD